MENRDNRVYWGKMKKAFINPEHILNKVEIKKGMQVADFGCGAGAWTIPTAFLVGNSGKVYALDILNYMLEVIGSKIKRYNLKNVELIRTDLELPKEIKVKKQSCDLVIICNLLFQSKAKEKIFDSAKKLLRRGGRILVIDWKPDALLGPEKDLRCKKENVKEIAKARSFALEKEIDAGHFHYGLLFKLQTV